MRVSEMALSLLILQVFRPGSGGVQVTEAAFSSPPSGTGTIAANINRAVGDPIVPSPARDHARKSSLLPLKNSLDDIEGFRRSPEDENDSDGPARSTVEQISEVLASTDPVAAGSDTSRLAKDVESTARDVQSKQEQLDRLKAQRDEILEEYAGPVVAAWLTPLAAIGAGRAYLQRRESVQTEIEAAKAELDAKRAELQRKEAQLGRMPRNFGDKKQKEESKLRVSIH